MIFQDPPYNPFDSNTPDLSPETKTQDQIIRMAIASAMMRMRVHLPAVITSVKGNQKVNVQPLIKSRYIDNSVRSLPEIQNVQVSMPMGKNYSIKLPIEVGDTGSLLFSDRSLDIWKTGDGGEIDPQDSRTHDISDPIFIPGLVPFANQTTDESKDLVLTASDAQLRLNPKGGFKLQNLKSAKELINILTQLVQTLSTASTVSGGPFTPDVVAFLTQTVEDLKTLQG